MDLASKDGAVLGIDVGFSSKGRTTCITLLEWDQSHVRVSSRRIGSDDSTRAKAIAELVGCRHLLGVALDGPLTKGLAIVPYYRSAEAILSRGEFQKRGKPGQTSTPTGQQLHSHATRLAQLVLANVTVAPSSHWEPIHEKRVVEAFPNLFLAAMVDESALPKLSRDASDRYWELVVDKSNRLEALITRLLPGRRLQDSLSECRHHEDRAGVVCAVTALSSVCSAHIAVGDPWDGDIILPPTSAWGVDTRGADTWLEPLLRKNVPIVRASKKAPTNHRAARVATATGAWF